MDTEVGQMKILAGKKASNYKEATAMAFQTAGVDGMSADIIDMFASLSAADKISGEADKSIGAAIKSRYGNKATWRAERWFVPIPKLSYDSKDIPQLIIDINIYLVAAVVVNTPQDSRLVTLAGTVGKPETLAIPMIFLHALLEKDLGRFAIVARDAGYTTWEVPGAKPVRLPNDFISELTEMLKYQSVVAWLGGFGSQGRCVALLLSVAPVSGPQYTQMLSTLIKFPLLFISGVFIPLSNLPEAARAVSFISPLTYFTDIARYATGHESYLPLYVNFLAMIFFTVVFWIVAVTLHNRTLPKRL